MKVLEFNNIFSDNEVSLREIIGTQEFQKTEIRPFSKEDAMRLLDDAFLDVEGRPLTERNKKEYLKIMVKLDTFLIKKQERLE